jgi:DNA-3-methyladenine glycosylase II
MARVSFTAASEAIAKRDKVMRGLVKRHGPVRIPKSPDSHFHALAESIVYQQLAGKAAAAIFGRFRALFDGDLTPEAVLKMSEKKLRGAGLSPNKMLSIQDLSRKIVDGTLPLESVARLKDEELIEKLVVVRGIGRWTAEMFLMFQLRRMDVWPVDDYGVRKGYANAYGLKELPKPKELMALGEIYRPYRTAAAWYCWRAVDTVTQGRS